MTGEPRAHRVEASVQRADWPAPASVQALTTLRGPAGGSEVPFDRFNLGLRSGDAEAAVLGNRALLETELGLPSAPCWLRQVHGTGVVRLGAENVGAASAASFSVDHKASRLKPLPQAEPEADAAVTSEAGVVLAILTADCLPVVFAAADGSEVAAAHAGWRGLSAGVLENTIAAMRASPGELLAWLGPAAGPRAYEIGEDVRAAFVDDAANAASAFVATRPGHWRVDLYTLARRRLSKAGIRPSAIHGGGRCTITEADRFFSHRRSTLEEAGRTGRMATLAWRAVP